MKPLSTHLRSKLCCPRCKVPLVDSGDSFVCSELTCKTRYPLVNGIPILINESNSLFDIAGFEGKKDTFWKTSALRDAVLPYLPDITKNVTASGNFRRLKDLLLAESNFPVVLIIGGSREGEGIRNLLQTSQIDFAEMDISYGPRTNLIGDGHDLPFADSTFDAVIVQAVLEHVVDPARVVQEIHRVLTKTGIVYADTPFMQQVHGGPYDFVRFTPLGHRRLFRQFTEIELGLTCGPAMALSHSIQYFLLSFVKRKNTRIAIKLFCRFTLFWLKYLDYLLARAPGALDAASSSYFMGRRCEQQLADRELITMYRGTN